MPGHRRAGRTKKRGGDRDAVFQNTLETQHAAVHWHRLRDACSAPVIGIAQEKPSTQDWLVDPMRGPVDLGLTDPSLIGAIDVHLHLDPDSPGTRGMVRAVDVFDAAKIAIARGMRGFVFKTHQDTGSASGAYMVRRHVSPTFEVFGRMASNYATGGINVAALEHFTQIKGGWGRIFELPTRDSITSATPFAAKDPAALKAPGRGC